MFQSINNSIQPHPNSLSHQIHSITSPLSDILTIEQTQTIRLQRLMQQRKRMQHMALLIQQQKQTIQILKSQNELINKQFYQQKLQNQILNDKLIVSFNHSQSLTSIVLKQIGLIQKLKSFLFNNLSINQYQQNILFQQIQSCMGLFNTIRNSKLSQQTLMNHKSQISQLNEEITKITEQNQILSEKYQQLCNNYLQLNKNNKIKQFQLIKYQKILQQNNLSLKNPSSLNKTSHNSHSHKHSKSHNKNHQSHEIVINKQLIVLKDNQINELKKKIQQLKVKITHQNQLIKEHRKNQKQQKKLLTFLQNKFNQQGKQLSQIAKSKQLIQNNSKTQMTYQIQVPVKSSSKRVPQSSNNKLFEQKNLNINQNSSINVSNFAPGHKGRSSKIIPPTQSGFKKTVSKNLIEP